MRTSRIIGMTAAIEAGALAAYLLAVRPRHIRWGASQEEIGRSMPGDDAIGDPNYITNRATTINAQPEDVWPWLVQMGEGRGGFYSYDWIEHLMGLQTESSSTVLPQFQQLQAGDVISAGEQQVRVLEVEPQRHLVLASSPDEIWGENTWTIALYPQGGQTRLVSRVRAHFHRSISLLMLTYVDPGQFFMERKWLMGIKQRAEALAIERLQTGAGGEAGPVQVRRAA